VSISLRHTRARVPRPQWVVANHHPHGERSSENVPPLERKRAESVTICPEVGFAARGLPLRGSVRNAATRA
jgi:hypothetical protein